MVLQKRNVIVRKLPESFSGKRGRTFLREVQDSMDTNRPRIVFDCSEIRELDRPAVETLLRCLEEAMKRNGDVKLAALSPGCEAILELAGADHLFEIYRTPIEAVNSFNLPSIRAVSLEKAPVTLKLKPGGAT